MSKSKKEGSSSAKQNQNTKAAERNGNPADNTEKPVSESAASVSKMKRVLSMVGVVLLLALYLLTFILAIVDNSASLQFFYASVVATILIPTLIWIYMFIYRLMNKDDRQNQ